MDEKDDLEFLESLEAAPAADDEDDVKPAAGVVSVKIIRDEEKKDLEDWLDDFLDDWE